MILSNKVFLYSVFPKGVGMSVWIFRFRGLHEKKRLRQSGGGASPKKRKTKKY